MKNKKYIFCLLLFIIIFLSGCSKHERLVNEGWVLDDHGIYRKTEIIEVDSEKGLELLEKSYGVWMDESEGHMYAQIDSRGVFVEGYGVSEFYNLYNLYIESEQIIWPNENKPKLPTYRFIIPNPTAFQNYIDLSINYISIPLPGDEVSDIDVGLIVVDVGDRGENNLFLVTTKINENQIPQYYYYSYSSNHPIYQEQIEQESEQRVKEEEEEQSQKKEKQLEQERQEEQRHQEQERIEEIKQEEEKIEQKKFDEARTIVINEIGNWFEDNYFIDENFQGKHFTIIPSDQNFILKELYERTSPSDEWKQLTNLLLNVSEVISQISPEDEYQITIMDPGLNSPLITVKNGKLIYDSVYGDF